MFKLGEQVAYVPSHAEGDLAHSDVEHGFVTSHVNDSVFCRFFRRDSNELRTTTDSEACAAEFLVPIKHRDQEIIRDIITDLYFQY